MVDLEIVLPLFIGIFCSVITCFADELVECAYIRLCKNKMKSEWNNWNKKISTFSVSEYFERMQAEAVKISIEQYIPYYPIVLWLGRNGLYMHSDGTTEWVLRNDSDITHQKVDGAII